MIETLMKQMEIQATVIDDIREVTDAIQDKNKNTGGGIQSLESKTRPLSNTTVWGTNEDGIYQGTNDFASPNEIKTGDTLNGKIPHKESHPEKTQQKSSTRPSF